jgi:hypothetical protein
VREDGNLWILMLKVVIVNCPACVCYIKLDNRHD